MVLECRVKGVPSPQVDWYREGKIIEDAPEFRILQKSKPCCCHTAVMLKVQSISERAVSSEFISHALCLEE